MRAGPRLLFVALLVLAAACRGPHPTPVVGRCTHLQATREVQGTALCEDAWTCSRPPDGHFDRNGLRRIAPCQWAPGPVVLFLPGMFMNSELAATEPRGDLRLYLAVAGIRTWGLDYRTHAVPPDADAEALHALAHWTNSLFVEDAAWATAFVRGQDPGPLVLAGFSAGADLAYRVASRETDALAGLVVLDGALDTERGNDTDDAIDVGSARLPFPERQRLLAAVLSDPGGPSPLPGFPTAGAALAEVLYTAPRFGGAGGLANTRDGVSDIRDLAALLQTYDRWWPRAALGAPAPRAPAHPLPVIAFASTRLGSPWIERVRASARAYGGSDSAVRELRGYGHLDVLIARGAAREVYAPVLAWLGMER